MSPRFDPEARKGLRRLRWRKSVSTAHMWINIALMALLWAMVNYLAIRNGFREDWSRQQPTALSERTLGLLEDLDEPVEAILFMEEGYRARDEATDLLTELSLRTDLLKLERVDPDRDLGRAKDLRTRFGLEEPNRLILVSGDRSRILPLEDMVVLEPEESRLPGLDPRMIGFRGEAVVGSGLLGLTRRESPVVYFLTGHDEKEVDNFSRTRQAYSGVRERLENEHIEVRTLDVDGIREVPDDADALVIAGPQTRISQPVVDMVRRYVNRGGRLMLMVDAGRETGLAPLLLNFGVRLSPDRVVEPGRTLIPGMLPVTEYGDHPATRVMDGIRTMFIQPRSILPVEGAENGRADRPVFTPLAQSGEEGWAESDPNQSPPRFNASVDRQGPVPVAAAVEIPGNGSSAGARLVVFGDSEFAGNRLNSGGGLQLVQHSMNWLLAREELIDIPPKIVEEIRLEMDQSGLNRLLRDVGLLLPLAVAVLGGWVSWRRRV